MARFTRSHRLTRPAEFRRVFDRPQRLGDAYVTVLARENDGSSPRLGLAVGRRKIARATQRNLFKRIVRESFRARMEQIGGHDVIVLPKPAAARASRATIRASIDRQWAILAQRAQQPR